MPIRTILLALWLLLPLGLWAQPARPALPVRADSQQAWLRRPGLADTTRVQLLLSLSRHHMATSLDSARELSQEAVALARRTGYGWGLARGLNSLAASFYYASDYPAAQRTFEQALRAAQRLGRPELIGHAYLGLGNVASELRNAVGLQQYYAQAQRAYADAKPRFVSGELLVIGNQANHYLNEVKPGLAAPLVRQGLGLLRQFPQAGRLSMFLNQLGRVQAMQQQPDSATATFLLAARQGRADHDAQAEGDAWLHLGALAVTRQRFAEALPYAQRAARLHRRLGDLQQVAEALDVQAIALAGLRRPEAYDTLRRYTTLRDSLLSQERMEAVATAQARFDQTEQQARIRELEQQRRIAELQAEQRTFRNRVLLAVLVLSSLLLAGLGAWGYRRRQAAREAALRTRLAADLHDDVGGLLTQISLESALLEEGQYTPAQQQQRLRRVAEASRAAARQMSDVVWSVDARNDSFASMLDRMVGHAQEVLPDSIELEFYTDPALRTQPLNLLARQSLYLIFKEALHNVVKHAQASEVRVSLRLLEGQLRLEVRDNGRGGPSAEQLASHGLRNMRMRAEAVGGTVRYENHPPGFGVVVLMPM